VWLGWLRALLAAAGDVPLIVHPLTGRHDAVYGDALPLEAVLHICTNIPQVVGWKMTYPYSAVRALAARLGTLDHHVGVFPANGSYFHEYLLSGYVDGAVTGCFNYALDVMLAHIRAWRHDDLAGARGIWDGGLYNLQQYIFSDSSRLHVRFKAAAWLRGYIDSPLMRPPMPAPEVEEVATLRSLLVQMGVDVRQDGQMAVPAGTLHL
jgi:4-hydroxy-tetrahydrodipicolinate synthase